MEKTRNWKKVTKILVFFLGAAVFVLNGITQITSNHALGLMWFICSVLFIYRGISLLRGGDKTKEE
ncbi:MAG TPA: hypothetical protein IAB33_01895 [Candidatus Pelethomonas intestinigallinarum]|nr:hypothetical protein [Candidatus Pelethomonas intestinigallinarum]